jgi:hypothetical protein
VGQFCEQTNKVDQKRHQQPFRLKSPPQHRQTLQAVTQAVHHPCRLADTAAFEALLDASNTSRNVVADRGCRCRQSSSEWGSMKRRNLLPSLAMAAASTLASLEPLSAADSTRKLTHQRVRPSDAAWPDSGFNSSGSAPCRFFCETLKNPTLQPLTLRPAINKLTCECLTFTLRAAMRAIHLRGVPGLAVALPPPRIAPAQPSGQTSGSKLAALLFQTTRRWFSEQSKGRR